MDAICVGQLRLGRKKPGRLLRCRNAGVVTAAAEDVGNTFHDASFGRMVFVSSKTVDPFGEFGRSSFHHSLCGYGRHGAVTSRTFGSRGHHTASRRFGRDASVHNRFATAASSRYPLVRSERTKRINTMGVHLPRALPHSSSSSSKPHHKRQYRTRSWGNLLEHESR